MRFIFLDDSKQVEPSRPRMGPLVAIGGFSIPAEAVRAAELSLGRACDQFGFPHGAPFKWSPGRDLWMRDGLVGESRRQFHIKVMEILSRAGAVGFVAIADTNCCTATVQDNDHETDVCNLVLERIAMHLNLQDDDGLVIADRPGGGRGDEEQFLLRCLEMRQEGAGYVIPSRLCMNVVSAPSKFIKLMQAADVITSCTLAAVAGERTFAPPIFEHIRPMLCKSQDRIGGVGVKIHPDFRYVNLYHWLLGDRHYVRMRQGVPLPLPDRPYARTGERYEPL